jgi:hypothetical protein
MLARGQGLGEERIALSWVWIHRLAHHSQPIVAVNVAPGGGCRLPLCPTITPAVDDYFACLETRTLLQRLLGFRHFFRHAYAIDLDGTRLDDLRVSARAVLPLLSEDLKRFDEFLSNVGRE